MTSYDVEGIGYDWFTSFIILDETGSNLFTLCVVSDVEAWLLGLAGAFLMIQEGSGHSNLLKREWHSLTKAPLHAVRLRSFIVTLVALLLLK